MDMFYSKYRCTPPGTQKHKGSIALFLIAILFVVSVICTSLASIAQATFSTGISSKIALQAQQYAEAEAALIRATKYDELTAHERTAIDNSLYESEIQISGETETADNIKQKTVSILIYRSSEENPRYTLKVPRLEVEPSSGVPIGTIIAWASGSDPEDGTWLECNGQSCTAYPQLVAVLGKSTVPDYRGVFLRGYGSHSSSHYGAVTHSSDALGVLQGDAIRNITGQFSGITSGRSLGKYPNGIEVFKLLNISQQSFKPDYANDNTEMESDISFDTSRVVPTSNENRPINIAVRYLIKAA